MTITIHAGHNKNGKIACGASDYIDESKEARILVPKIRKHLKNNGIKSVDVTVNNGKNQNDVLVKIVNKCNNVNRALDVSIHFNSFKHSSKDGKTKGCEVLVYDANDRLPVNIGHTICKKMEKIGFTNRGVKEKKDLYFLRKTNAKAMLIEVCFVDDLDDVTLYKNKKNEIAKIIAESIYKFVV